MTVQRKYDETDITGFTRDLEKIQAKPTLYIGPTDDAGIFTLLRECMDNAVDEARAGRNDFIYVDIGGLQGPFTVVDRGIGIPVEIHPKMKVNTLTHVLTNLQSSGKMKVDGAYKSSVGAHGVGIKAVNALSSTLKVWTYRKVSGGWHSTSFAKGHETQSVKKCESPKVKGLKIESGTVMVFTPDEKVFKQSKLKISSLLQWAKMTAHMNAGLKIKISYKGKTKGFYSKDGIKSYLAERIEYLKATPFSKKHIFHNSGTLELALAFTDVEGSQVEFFTNTVRNAEEGVHADDVYKALYDSLKVFAKPAKAKKKKSESRSLPFTPSDLRDGLLGVVNYKIDAPQFDSQTKEKLVDSRVKGACYEETMKVLSKFWSENKSLAKDLIARASELRSKTADFLKDKNLIKNVNKAKSAISSKLARVVGTCPPEKRELFLVEGDSAGGSAKRARDKSFQAVYPLKGKPLNAENATKEKVNDNAEIVGLLAALGIDLTAKDYSKTVQYGKVIVLADPDVDGKHINCLLLSNLWKYVPHLIRNGNVFAVKAPLFIAKKGSEVYFGKTRDEIYEKSKTKNIDITYLKGWGECDASDLKVVLDPGVRTLYRIMPPDKKGDFDFRALMGKDASYRKKLLGVI